MRKEGVVKIVDRALDIPLKNDIGKFFIGGYKFQEEDGNIIEAYIVYKSSFDKIKNVRINSACFTSDLFGCTRCDCHEQMVKAMRYFSDKKNGLLIYLMHHEGRGVGIVNKLKTLTLMDELSCSTSEAFSYLNLESDERDYSVAIAILNDLGINDINIITNNPEKIDYLKKVE